MSYNNRFSFLLTPATGPSRQGILVSDIITIGSWKLRAGLVGQLLAGAPQAVLVGFTLADGLLIEAGSQIRMMNPGAGWSEDTEPLESILPNLGLPNIIPLQSLILFEDKIPLVVTNPGRIQLDILALDWSPDAVAELSNIFLDLVPA